MVAPAPERNDELNDDDDDDELSLIDDKSSTISSSVNLPATTDGYDTDIESGSTKNQIKSSFAFCSEALAPEDHDVSGKNQYRDLCQQSNVIPCTYFMGHIQDKELVLRYHQFSSEDVRVIARTLSVSFSFQFVFLDFVFVRKSRICSLKNYCWTEIFFNNKQRNTSLK